MKQIQNIKSAIEAPKPPVKFTLDGKHFSFNPLPLGTLLCVERLKESLKINERLLEVAPLAAWLLVAEKQSDDMRRIVCCLLSNGDINRDIDAFRDRLEFLREHCAVDSLCSLFIIGSMAQNIWLRDAGKDVPADMEGISEHDFWNTPFIKLNKKQPWEK